MKRILAIILIIMVLCSQVCYASPYTVSSVLAAEKLMQYVCSSIKDAAVAAVERAQTQRDAASIRNQVNEQATEGESAVQITMDKLYEASRQDKNAAKSTLSELKDSIDRQTNVDSYPEVTGHQSIDAIICAFDECEDTNSVLAAFATLSMRESKYTPKTSTNDYLDAIEGRTASTNQMADIKAEEIETLLSNSYSELSDADKMQLTLGDRAIYHYFGMMAGSSYRGNTVVNKLSSAEDPTNRNYEFTVSAVRFNEDVENKINNYKHWAYLSNCLNEALKLTKDILVQSAGITLENAETQSSVTTLLKLQQLRLLCDTLGENCLTAKDLYTVEIDYNGQKYSVQSEIERLEAAGINLEVSSFTPGAEEEPLRNFYNLSTDVPCESIQKGIALSATFVPLKTNLYDPTTYAILKDDGDFFEFHERYGYNRKAVYIDTNIASVSELYTTNKKGNLRVATLRDLLHPDKEIALYTDDNFYNKEKLDAYKAEGDHKLEGENNIFENIADAVVGAFTTDMTDILKTDNKTKYASGMRDIDSYTKSNEEDYKGKGKNGVLLSGYQIDQFIGESSEFNGYNVMQPYSFVSSVYRCEDLKKLIDSIGVRPIFMSSKDLASGEGVSAQYRDSIFNYALLKNIQDNNVIGYRSNLDYNKPVYVDCYGNIVTESGNVVVPAAANATLQNGNYYPINAAFLTSYGAKYKLPASVQYISGDPDLSSCLQLNEDGSEYVLKQVKLNDTIDLNQISYSSLDTKETFYGIALQRLQTNSFDNKLMFTNIFMEVMRGAPLEYIDKAIEGLNNGVKINKSSVLQAIKLENFKESLSSYGQNSILSIPNLAFIDGIEYIILFVYKIALVSIIGALIVQIFIVSMRGAINLRTVGAMILTVALTISSMVAIPAIYDLSYYQTNKALLQREAELVAIVDLEKRLSGVEIGMQDVVEPESKTKLYLKMEDVNIPWYDVFVGIVHSNVTTSLTDIYLDYAKDNLAFDAEGFEFHNGALYIDIDTLFDASEINFSPKYNVLSQTANSKTPASFYTPYYAFVRVLLQNINNYNLSNDVFSYSTQVYAGGKVKSLGLVKPYFDSDVFVQDTYDILDLREIYGVALEGEEADESHNAFDLTEIQQMQMSQWFNENIEDSELDSRIEKLDQRAKNFVYKNKYLLGKVSDDSFVRMMALDLSLYYNKIFGIPCAQAIEIYDMSTDDLTRLSMVDYPTAAEDSPLGYSRFIMENAGESGIYVAALLEGILFISGWVKPLATVGVLIAIYLSLFLNKLVLRRKSDGVKGYLKILVLLFAINVLFALMLKVSMALPALGLTPTVCLVIQSILQVLVIAAYLWIATVVVINWKDLGNAKMSATAAQIVSIVNKVKDHTPHIGRRGKKGDGWGMYNKMIDKDKYRRYDIIRKDDDI